MTDTTLKQRLRRKPRWKVKEERNELMLQQQQIRLETEKLETQVNNLKEDEIVALKSNDGATIAVIEEKIRTAQEKIAQNDKRYKENAAALKVYSEVAKNDSDSDNNTLATVIGVITGIGGLAIGGVGLMKAYESDEAGTLVRKKTFDWVKGLPIVRDIGKKKLI